MKKNFLKSLPLSLAVIYLPFNIVPGHYYLDLGTASLLFQLALGALVGGWYISKTYWQRIKIYLKKLFKRGSQNEDNGE